MPCISVAGRFAYHGESTCSSLISAWGLRTAPRSPPMPSSLVHRGKHFLGFLAGLAWIGVAWTFWQAHAVRPRQRVPLAVPIRYCGTAYSRGLVADIDNESWNELAFLDLATGRK